MIKGAIGVNRAYHRLHELTEIDKKNHPQESAQFLWYKKRVSSYKYKKSNHDYETI